MVFVCLRQLFDSNITDDQSQLSSRNILFFFSNAPFPLLLRYETVKATYSSYRGCLVSFFFLDSSSIPNGTLTASRIRTKTTISDHVPFSGSGSDGHALQRFCFCFYSIHIRYSPSGRWVLRGL